MPNMNEQLLSDLKEVLDAMQSRLTGIENAIDELNEKLNDMREVMPLDWGEED